jgi:hypothetical protein
MNLNLNLQKYLNKIENSNINKNNTSKNNTSKNNITLKFREKGLPIQEGFALYNPSEIKNRYTIVNKKLKFKKLYPENNEEKSLLTNFQSNISGNNTLGTESIIFLNIGKNYMLRIAKKNQDETLKSCLIHKLLIEKYGDNNEHILKIYEFGILSPEKKIYSILKNVFLLLYCYRKFCFKNLKTFFFFLLGTKRPRFKIVNKSSIQAQFIYNEFCKFFIPWHSFRNFARSNLLNNITRVHFQHS